MRLVYIGEEEELVTDDGDVSETLKVLKLVDCVTIDGVEYKIVQTEYSVDSDTIYVHVSKV